VSASIWPWTTARCTCPATPSSRGLRTIEPGCYHYAEHADEEQLCDPREIINRRTLEVCLEPGTMAEGDVALTA